jgi:hypothetical protein
MLDFIPFIPSSTEGIPDTLWKTALHSWTFNLSQLLSLSNTDFLEETTSNTSLSTFIDQVLNAQLDITGDATLLKYIFLIYYRLSLVEPSTTTTTHHALLTSQKLCSFAIIYNASNTVQLRAMMTAFVQHYEVIEKQLVAMLDMLLENLQAIPEAMNENAYVLLRLLEALLSATLDAIPFPSQELDQTLMTCYQALPIIKEEDEGDDRTTTYLIKRSLVSIFNLYADVHFFRPLGFVSSLTNHHKLIATEQYDVQDKDAVLEHMSATILKYIEESGLDEPRSSFEDAPLIMDWEIEFHIAEKLAFINENKFAGDEERLEILKLSMEQVRDTNIGNHGSLILETIQQQQQSERITTSTAEEEDPELELMSRISQVLDMFPTYGEGFIEVCLNVNGGDVERVIMQLLDDTLPSTVSGLDRSMERNAASTMVLTSEVNKEEQEEESILKSRRNIYDNDEFDIFARRTVDASKVYIGKKDKGNADMLLDDKTFIQTEKKNVLQRVVDMYDDDYDDTYDDINDAGVPTDGDGDSALDIVRNKTTMDPGVQNESTLVHAFMENPELFGRNGTARKSTQRASLRKVTAMSDEQLEGWATMFSRNVRFTFDTLKKRNRKLICYTQPRKNRILDKYMLFDGNQKEVTEEQSQAQKQALKKENKRLPVSEAKDHAYKDKNKARFGNHNRKIQRDKKAAKAGPPPS